MHSTTMMIQIIVCIHFHCFCSYLPYSPMCTQLHRKQSNVFCYTQGKKSVVQCIIYCGVLISVVYIKLWSFYNKKNGRRCYQYDITQVHDYTSGPMMEACILLLNARILSSTKLYSRRLKSKHNYIIIIIIIIVCVCVCIYIYIYHHHHHHQYSALRPVQQEPEPSQATSMALAHCILDKFLGVGCHYFPPI